ncbi:hypothetical protein SCHPADRAFT_502559 [Schizopora paradoxa]|uniref:Uncharacterized protein n=1 Tax=Schizopora paradoxa TaxID=27342 RepID=A0A0H2RGS1_9AGAM|nr:hypothetical protein SCHPADRAFT_502559 [Schizopora paradoxa]
MPVRRFSPQRIDLPALDDDDERDASFSRGNLNRKTCRAPSKLEDRMQNFWIPFPENQVHDSNRLRCMWTRSRSPLKITNYSKNRSSYSIANGDQFGNRLLSAGSPTSVTASVSDFGLIWLPHSSSTIFVLNAEASIPYKMHLKYRLQTNE